MNMYTVNPRAAHCNNGLLLYSQKYSEAKLLLGSHQIIFNLKKILPCQSRNDSMCSEIGWTLINKLLKGMQRINLSPTLYMQDKMSAEYM